MPATPWDTDARGVLLLPSGRLVRGRALRRPHPDGPLPEFGLYLAAKQPGATPWPQRWLRWRDLRTPDDHDQVRAALLEVWQRSADERVEIGCGGGRGRTGTALACLAVLDGVAPQHAVAYVREHYDHRAVETPWQARYARRFAPQDPAPGI